MHKFCRLTLDHSHVQSNKCIKGEGIVVGLKEDWPSCSLELKFGRARKCSSAVVKFAIMMEKQIPGTMNKLYCTTCQHLNKMLLMS